MHIHKYAHSAVVLEEQGRGLLFDPGMFSFPEDDKQPADFRDIDAIVVTHIHGDHFDPNAVRAVLAANPEATIFTNQQVVDELRQQGVTATVLEQGSVQIGPFTIEALPAAHEKNLFTDGVPINIAYRVNNTVVHPGDSFSEELAPWQGVPVLLAPIVAPWQNEIQLYTFVRTMKPRQVIPIHDGYIKDFFLQGRYQTYSDFFGREAIEFVPLAHNTSAEIKI
jgi:L-ascorbate metabolism protein UlaG (beta-lactamase superfamily)